MAKHKPTVIWPFYRNLTKDTGLLRSGYLQTVDTKSVEVTLTDHKQNTYGIHLTRDEARMLAKRINQCLEDTR